MSEPAAARMRPVGLDQAIKVGRHGRPHKGEKKGAVSTFKRGSTSRAYILARLERDGFAEQAVKVRAGGMSAAASRFGRSVRKRGGRRREA